MNNNIQNYNYKQLSVFRINIKYAIIAIFILIPIGLANSYIFLESNITILGLGLILSSLILIKGRLSKKMFNGFFVSYSLFFIHSMLSLNFESDVAKIYYVATPLAKIELINLAYFFLCFYGSALIYKKYGYLSDIIKYLVLLYIVAFIIRNSTPSEFESLINGYNLSPGFLVIALLPFVFITSDTKNITWFPYIIAVLLMFWLALIGSRTSVLSIIIFLLALWIMPLITKNKLVYLFSFFVILTSIFLSIILYLYFADNNTDPLIGNSFFEIFNKRVGTRIEIWQHLTILINEAPWFGHGMEQITSYVHPIKEIEFTANRDNLSAHSTYFEILYRLGIVGIIFFLFSIFFLWIGLWQVKDQWTARVLGAYIIMLLAFMTTTKFLVLSPSPLYSGFSWIVLGIGAGLSMRKSKYKDKIKGMSP